MQKPPITLQWVTHFHLGCLCCGQVWDANKHHEIYMGADCPTESCRASAGTDGLQQYLDAAKEHGNVSEPDHEVGDLQDALRVAWGLMTAPQKALFLADTTVKQLIADYDNGDLPADRAMLEAIPDVYLVTQEGGATGELYVHTFRNDEEAVAYRHNCVDDGSYRTAPPVKLTGLLPHCDNFHEMAESIVRATAEIDYP